MLELIIPTLLAAEQIYSPLSSIFTLLMPNSYPLRPLLNQNRFSSTAGNLSPFFRPTLTMGIGLPSAEQDICTETPLRTRVSTGFLMKYGKTAMKGKIIRNQWNVA